MAPWIGACPSGGRLHGTDRLHLRRDDGVDLILLDISGETSKLPPGASPACLITPDGSAFSYAFLGAYFFGLQVVRRPT